LGGGLTLIGVMRSLGPCGIPLYTVCEEHDFVMRSRWYREPAPHTNAQPDGLAAFLRWLPLERAVLMPCTDDWLRAVSELPDALSRRFPSSLPPRPIIRTMIDKWRFAQALERAGTPHPETVLVNSCVEIEGADPANLKDRILKPLFSVDFARKHGVKGYLIRDKADALRVAGSLDYPILLQDYIPGPPTAHVFIDGFVDRAGRVCARFARRRLRMYPPNLGNSSFLISVPLREVDAARKALDRLLASVSYRGIFSAEFKYDYRDGTFKILEVNARPWWYVEFASHCGVNVCQLAYRDALGLPLEPVRKYQTGRRCVLLPYDFHAFRNGRINGGPGAWSWARSCAGAHGALLSWNDPVPAIVYGWRVLAGSLQRSVARWKQPGS
jgi:predicted ATP-grasp superfamily ATP-dependent carboligase